MPATLLNAPARPLLTGRTIAVLLMAVLAALTLALVIAPDPDHPVANRPAFARRMTTLPAIVVTAPEIEAAAEPGEVVAR